MDLLTAGLLDDLRYLGPQIVREEREMDLLTAGLLDDLRDI